jgi:hypothetical protein
MSDGEVLVVRRGPEKEAARAKNVAGRTVVFRSL